MTIQDFGAIAHDLTLFDDAEEFRLCWHCGEPVDRHGICMTENGCDCCQEIVE